MSGRRIRELFRIHPRGTDVPGDVDAEIAFHIEERIAHLIASGLSVADATSEARRRFGDAATMAALRAQAERVEQRRRGREWMQGLRHDVASARSNLLKRPAFTIAMVGIIAIGIAANVAVFAVTDRALLRSLPFPEGHRLAFVQRDYDSPDDPQIDVPRFRDFAQRQRSMDGIAAVKTVGRMTLFGRDAALSAGTALVDENFFPLLRAPMVAGRSFSAEEVRTGAHVAVIGETLWRTSLQADRTIINRTLMIDRVPFTIIGVAPARAVLLSGGAATLWLPLPADATDFTAVARMRAGVPADSASAIVSQDAARVWGDAKLGHALLVRDAHEVLMGGTRAPLFMLSIAVALVLAIVCANVVNLYLVRTIARSQEFAIRVSLGATRWRIVRQLMVESAALIALSAILALLLATNLLGVITAVADPRARLAEISIDARPVAFAAGVACACWALLSLTAGLRAVGMRGAQSLGSAGNRTTGGRGALYARRGLVAVELAFSVMLVVSAGLMLRTVNGMLRIDTGFDYRNLMSFDLVLPESTTGTAEAQHFYDALLPRVRALPGVTAAGATSTIPLGARHSSTKFVAGADEGFALYASVTSGYMEAMRIPLITGRAPKVAGEVVVSRTFASKYFASRNAVGAHVRLGSNNPRDAVVTGISGDVRQEALTEGAGAMIYEYSAAVNAAPTTLVVRFRGDGRVLAREVQAAIREVNDGIAVANRGLFEDAVRGTIADRTTLTNLLSGFGVVALVLALLGVHAVTAHSVGARTREFALRMAIGATRGNVLGQVIREEIGAMLIGIACGAAGAWAFSHVLSKWVYGVSTRDPATFAIAVALMAATGVAATLLPARRATQVEPQVVLNS